MKILFSVFFIFISGQHLIEPRNYLEGLAAPRPLAVQIKYTDEGCHQLHFIYCSRMSVHLEKAHCASLQPPRRQTSYSQAFQRLRSSITSAPYIVDSSPTSTFSFSVSSILHSTYNCSKLCFPCAVSVLGMRQLQSYLTTVLPICLCSTSSEIGHLHHATAGSHQQHFASSQSFLYGVCSYSVFVGHMAESRDNLQVWTSGTLVEYFSKETRASSFVQ